MSKDVKSKNCCLNNFQFFIAFINYSVKDNNTLPAFILPPPIMWKVDGNRLPNRDPRWSS
jgi:hypothetical protein